MKRFISLLLVLLMLFPLGIAMADEDPSGSSRAGDTVTWTANGNGGTTGFSDTTTYDDVEGEDVGSGASSNMAHKTGDSKGHVNTTGSAQFNPAGRKGDDVCLYFNRHGEMSCYSDGDAETGIPGTVVYETYWTVTDGDGNYIPPAGAFGSDSSTRQTG